MASRGMVVRRRRFAACAPAPEFRVGKRHRLRRHVGRRGRPRGQYCRISDRPRACQPSRRPSYSSRPSIGIVSAATLGHRARISTFVGRRQRPGAVHSGATRGVVSAVFSEMSASARTAHDRDCREPVDAEGQQDEPRRFRAGLRAE